MRTSQSQTGRKFKKLDLSDQDKKDLVEFMKQGCTGDLPKVASGRLPE
jgi:hypothetical protein